MTTGIIIVNYKVPWHLDLCLESIFKHSTDIHIFLVHQTFDPKSIKVGEKYKRLYPDKITIKINEKNTGYTGGVQSVYKEAMNFERICLMNPDCIATKCWLEEMNKVLDKYEDVVQVSPDSNQYYNEKLFWRIVRWQIKRRFPKLGDRIYRYLLYFNPPRSSDHYEFKDTGDAFYLFCGGFCNLIRTKYFRDLGYILDPKIVHGYGDDFDLSYYLRQFGKIGSVNSSYVFHFVNTSLRKLNTHSLKDKVKFLNRMYVVGKWNDRLRKDISNLDQETLFNLVQNHPEVNFMVQYFGLIDINPKLEPYFDTAPANEFKLEFLK